MKTPIEFAFGPTKAKITISKNRKWFSDNTVHTVKNEIL